MCKKLIVFFLISLFLPLYPAAAQCMPATAKNYAADCVYVASSNPEDLEKLTDESRDSAWSAAESGSQYLEIQLPEGKTAAGVYIMWNCVPGEWALSQSDGSPVWHAAELGSTEGFINCYAPLNAGTSVIRIETASRKWKLDIAEIKVYGSGELPADVQVWKPQPDKADLMVVSAHPDDELIYFGGTLPYYAGHLKKHTAVVYMTSSPMIRKFEALDGLWKVGVREYPVFLPLENKYSSELADAKDIWGGLDAVVSLLAGELRRFKPDVVVTHDLGGEYGHGAHMLTALAVQKAVDRSSDPGKYTESADEFGAWQVKKCYLHLYEESRISMNWNTPLSAFGGKTALDMAKDGYALHVSQHFRERPILDTGEYDNSAYGLYYTSVGPDTAGGDMFENVPAPLAATAEPTTAAASSPPATEAPAAPVAQKSAPPQDGAANRTRAMEGVIAVVVMMFAAAGLWVIADKKTLASAKHAKKQDDPPSRRSRQ